MRITKNRASNIWYPFTQMKTAPEPLRIKSGKGAVLETEDGKKILDCISSWWVTIHGHGNARISEAIYKQALQLEHVIFPGCIHDPAEKLANKLVEILPDSLCKVFFVDNGATAVEVALKQAFQYWQNVGKGHRKRFLCFENSYHGDTLGAMSLGSRSIFNKPFESLLFDATFAPFPATFIDDPHVDKKERDSLNFIEKELSKPDHSYAGILVEPLVQGAGGMKMCRPQFLKELQKLAHAYDALLIYDEVMTGFGRTGEWFACKGSGTCPDIICLSKGLTGGFLPLAVTVSNQKIYDSFYSDDPSKLLFHSHSYTANPLGCIAACESIAMLEEKEEFRGLQEKMEQQVKRFKATPKVQDLRVCGTILAMDIKTKAPGYFSKIGPRLRALLLEQGLLTRPIGNVVYFMPPYCVADEQLELMFTGLENALEHL